MAYKLKPDETVASAVKRIAREELDKAIEELRAGEDGAVHQARKRLKKVRALLRLVRRDLGATYRTENSRLRDVGQKLSPVRDAEALIEAVDRVTDRRPALRAERPSLVRHKQQVEKQIDIRTLAPKLAAALETVRGRIDKWPLNGHAFNTAETGMEASYRKGRKALARYLKTGRREDEHEWRKRVKDHWYHVRLLEEFWDPSTEKLGQSLKELEDALGEHLNLAMLRERARRDGARSAIDAERRELLDRAMEIGERLYAPKPKRVINRIRRLWR